MYSVWGGGKGTFPTQRSGCDVVVIYTYEELWLNHTHRSLGCHRNEIRHTPLHALIHQMFDFFQGLLKLRQILQQITVLLHQGLDSLVLCRHVGQLSNEAEAVLHHDFHIISISLKLAIHFSSQTNMSELTEINLDTQSSPNKYLTSGMLCEM